mmetsp:Transcript_33798/g.61024  ORF Transcript_33798/g.61024 Transcript_33798/m.61024 type:complete len:204 (-) Transcript_33798:294-905(-)
MASFPLQVAVSERLVKASVAALDAELRPLLKGAVLMGSTKVETFFGFLPLLEEMGLPLRPFASSSFVPSLASAMSPIADIIFFSLCFPITVPISFSPSFVDIPNWLKDLYGSDEGALGTGWSNLSLFISFARMIESCSYVFPFHLFRIVSLRDLLSLSTVFESSPAVSRSFPRGKVKSWFKYDVSSSANLKVFTKSSASKWLF